MPSAPLDALQTGLDEVRDLQRANPAPADGFPVVPRVTRAINRASVVMLSSHFEKYLYSVVEEAVLLVNGAGVPADRLPTLLRLQHSKQAIDDLGRTQWENRALQLEQFAGSEAWLWTGGGRGALTHDKLMTWMKTPKSRQIGRLYRLWGIHDIFAEITRTPFTRNRLVLRIDELVGKRNNIAHGDFAADATPGDINGYLDAVWTFCERADRRLARLLRRTLVVACAWY